MSKDLEILPSKELSTDWPNLFTRRMSSKLDLIGIDKDGARSFFVTWNQNRTLHIYFSAKERQTFPESSYLEGIPNANRIDVEQFLGKFTSIDYYMTLSSTGGRRMGELELMVRTAAILAEMTQGIIIFQQSLLGYKGNMIYLPEDLL